MRNATTTTLRCANGRVIEALPEICVHCGSKATHTRQALFAKQSMTMLVLMLILGGGRIFYYLITRHVAAELPVCTAHVKGLEQSQSQRALGAGGAFLFAVVGGFLGLRLGERFLPYPAGILLPVVIIFLVIFAWFRYVRWIADVKAIAMTNTSVTLANVAPNFAAAISNTMALGADKDITD